MKKGLFETIENFIKNLFKGKELNYPYEFAIVDYSPSALQRGIMDKFNKIIRFYTMDKYGNRIEKKLNFSPERIYILTKMRRIPVYDKTLAEEVRFPVFGRILPGEIEVFE